MQTAISQTIDEIIQTEGGYVDHPADRGGPTKYGITLATLRAWRESQSRGAAPHVDADTVRDLTIEEARKILTHEYWIGPGLSRLQLPLKVCAYILDAAVHHGPRAAIRMLQRAAQVEADGIIGPITSRAVHVLPARELAARFLAARVVELGRIITSNSSQAVFAHGWMRRVANQIRELPEVE